MEKQQAYAPGQEYIEPNEDIYIEKIIQAFKKQLPKYYPTGQVKRMFHPKMHGLVKAVFKVPDDLEAKYQQGIFQKGAEYPCWVRFSNAKKKPASDIKKDMRGMAIKLIGVPGEKLLNAHRNDVTHDFLLVTSKTLQTRSVHDFQKSLSALMGGGLKLLWYALTHLSVVIRSIKQISKCSNLLETEFFSTTPYRFGNDETKAVKYAAIPQDNQASSMPVKPTKNFLKKRLISDLSHSDYCFDFMVQFQEDPSTMPIEDPTVAWTSPYVKVATIRIPKQHFNSPAQENYAEKLSFTPWHCTKAHQPIGGVNRARKAVYIALSDFRHKLNGKHEHEPTSMEFFN